MIKDNMLLIGAGAVGVFFSARLSQAGAEITVAARSDYEIVRKNGYTGTCSTGNFVWKPRIVRNAAEFGGKAGAIIIAAKALPDVDLAEMVRPATDENTVFILIQNGLDVETELHRSFPDNKLISAVAYIGVSRVAPGKIVQDGTAKLTLGLYPEGDAPEIEELCQAWNQAGVECRASGDIELVRWRKLLWNVPFNPISVLTGGYDTNQMMSDGDVAELAEKLMKEVQSIAAASGKILDDAMIEDNLNYTRNFPPYKTSMLLDFINHRPLEIDAIVGSVIRRARKYGVDTPIMDTVYTLLKACNAQNLKVNKK